MGTNTISPNMGLIIPTPGQELAPTWASDISNSLSTVDAHDHTPGKGASISSASLNIDSPLEFNPQNNPQPATGLAFVSFVTQSMSIPEPIALSLYSDGTDLWYQDGNSIAIQITKNEGVAASSSGISSPPASAGFLSSILTVLQNGSIRAAIDAGTYFLRYSSTPPSPPSGNYIGINAPAGISDPYNLTLPNQVATSFPSFFISDTDGNLGYAQLDSSLYVVGGFNGSLGVSEAIQAAIVPTGCVIPFAGNSAPTPYWLICDGSAVSRTAYASLFAVINTIFGSGDGSTTFNLPDMRGRTPIGAGQSVGLSNRILAQQLGEEIHQLTVPEMPAHSHTVNLNDGASPGNNNIAEQQENGGPTTNTSFVGGNIGHNNMQPSLVLNYIIKT